MSIFPFLCPAEPDPLPLPYILAEEHYVNLPEELPVELASPPALPEMLALTDIQHYQREPSGSDFPPPGPAQSSLASPEERIQRLEELVDGLGTMLDMVKEQVRGSCPSPRPVLEHSGSNLGAGGAGNAWEAGQFCSS